MWSIPPLAICFPQNFDFVINRHTGSGHAVNLVVHAQDRCFEMILARSLLLFIDTSLSQLHIVIGEKCVRTTKICITVSC